MWSSSGGWIVGFVAAANIILMMILTLYWERKYRDVRGNVQLEVFRPRLALVSDFGAACCLGIAFGAALIDISSGKTLVQSILRPPTLSILILGSAILLQNVVIPDRTTLQFTDKGMVQRGMFVAWEQIKSYRWIDTPKRQLNLHMAGMVTSTKIPDALEDEVDRVLSKHLSKR